MKRFFSALLAVVLVAGLCSGCGGDSHNKGANSNRDMPKPAEGG